MENKMDCDIPKPLRSHREIFLVGSVKADFVPTRIPSNKEVLQVFFHQRKMLKLSVSESLNATVNKVMCLDVCFLKRKDHIKKEISRLYGHWRGNLFGSLFF